MAAPLIPRSVQRQFTQMTESMMDSDAVLTITGEFVPTGGGAGYYAPDTIETFKCRLRPMDNNTDIRETLAGGQMDVTNFSMMFYPLAARELTSDTPLTIDGEDYKVTGTPPVGTYSAHRVAVVRRLRDPVEGG